MKRLQKTVIACLLAFLSLPMVVHGEEESFSYGENPLDSSWQFYLGEEDILQEEISDSLWRDVSLPHDWSIELGFREEGEAESGYALGGLGWYRKSLVLGPEYSDSEIVIVFGGVYQNSTVFVNGEEIGSHPFGYTEAAYRIDPYLIFDGETENETIVRVDHRIASSRWYSGSGILRHVTLKIQNPIHIAHHGVRVQYVSSEEGITTLLDTEIEHHHTSREGYILQQTLRDEEGNVIQEVSDTFQGGDSFISISQTLEPFSPNLWQINRPYLYTLETSLFYQDQLIDQVETSFGYRFCKFDGNQGFFLNDIPTKLKGVCLHHDQGALGGIENEAAISRQLDLLKEMGANAIRTTHNPASDTLLRLCAEKGILVIEEFYDTWLYPKNGNDGDASASFLEQIEEDNTILGGTPGMTWAQFDVQETIRKDRNNPAIIMWSIGNELFGNHGGDVSSYPMVAEEIISWVKEMDDRPITIGDNHYLEEDEVHNQINGRISQSGGIIGYNYVRGTTYDERRENHPDWILYGSETTSIYTTRDWYSTKGVDQRAHQVSGYGLNAIEWGDTLQNAWKDVITRDFVLGEFVWTGFDYLGEPEPWNGFLPGSVTGEGPRPHTSFFGVIDTAGFPKDGYYFLQSVWNEDVSTLHILPDWQEDNLVFDGDGNVEVLVYSDAPSVELFLNNVSLGRKEMETYQTSMGYFYQMCEGELYYRWLVPYEEGRLLAIAYDSSDNVIEDTEGRSFVQTPNEGNTIAVNYKSFIQADDNDLSYVEVSILDENGIETNEERELEFFLGGNGRIVGVDNGNSNDITPLVPDDPYHAKKFTFQGKGLAIIQSINQPGIITLTISSEGLEPQTIEIQTNEKAPQTISRIEKLQYHSPEKETNSFPIMIGGGILGILFITYLLLRRRKST